jgi:very-short-patch-repair endonuclease
MRHDSTPGKKALWEMLRAGRCGGARFRRQEQIGGFIVDFACLSERIVIEVDGDRHDSPMRVHRDAARDRSLGGIGFRVLRFSEWEAREGPLGIADGIWSLLPGNRRVPSEFEFAELDS